MFVKLYFILICAVFLNVREVKSDCDDLVSCVGELIGSFLKNDNATAKPVRETNVLNSMNSILDQLSHLIVDQFKNITTEFDFTVDGLNDTDIDVQTFKVSGKVKINDTTEKVFLLDNLEKYNDSSIKNDYATSFKDIMQNVDKKYLPPVKIGADLNISTKEPTEIDFLDTGIYNKKEYPITEEPTYEAIISKIDLDGKVASKNRAFIKYEVKNKINDQKIFLNNTVTTVSSNHNISDDPMAIDMRKNVNFSYLDEKEIPNEFITFNDTTKNNNTVNKNNTVSRNIMGTKCEDKKEGILNATTSSNDTISEEPVAVYMLTNLSFPKQQKNSKEFISLNDKTKGNDTVCKNNTSLNNIDLKIVNKEESILNATAESSYNTFSEDPVAVYMLKNLKILEKQEKSKESISLKDKCKDNDTVNKNNTLSHNIIDIKIKNKEKSTLEAITESSIYSFSEELTAVDFPTNLNLETNLSFLGLQENSKEKTISLNDKTIDNDTVNKNNTVGHNIVDLKMENKEESSLKAITESSIYSLSEELMAVDFPTNLNSESNLNFLGQQENSKESIGLNEKTIDYDTVNKNNTVSHHIVDFKIENKEESSFKAKTESSIDTFSEEPMAVDMPKYLDLNFLQQQENKESIILSDATKRNETVNTNNTVSQNTADQKIESKEENTLRAKAFYQESKADDNGLVDNRTRLVATTSSDSSNSKSNNFTPLPNKSTSYTKSPLMKPVTQNKSFHENDISFYKDLNTKSEQENVTDYLDIDYISLFKDVTVENVTYIATTYVPSTSTTPVTTTEVSDDTGIESIYPWIAAVFIKENDNEQFQYVCDGSLVSERVVLTAARCLTDVTEHAPDVLVILGKTSLQAIKPTEMVVRAKLIKLHEAFTGTEGKVENDLGIIVLNEAVTPSKDIFPVKITDDDIEEDEHDNNYDEHGGIKEKNLATTGWHVTGPITPIYFEEVSECSANSPDTFCAIYGDNGTTCPSIGGAFVSKTDKQWSLRGIMSGVPSTTGVCFNRKVTFTNISRYYPWIMANIDNFSREYLMF